MENKEICQICKLNEHCQHNFDNECIEAYGHISKTKNIKSERLNNDF